MLALAALRRRLVPASREFFGRVHQVKACQIEGGPQAHVPLSLATASFSPLAIIFFSSGVLILGSGPPPALRAKVSTIGLRLLLNLVSWLSAAVNIFAKSIDFFGLSVIICTV